MGYFSLCFAVVSIFNSIGILHIGFNGKRKDNWRTDVFIDIVAQTTLNKCFVARVSNLVQRHTFLRKK